MKVRLGAALSLIAGVGLAVFSAFSLWPSSAEATIYMVNVTLNESQAISTCNPNPPPADGGGAAIVTYDTSTMTLSWNITFQNLSGPALAAHFHGPAHSGENAGIEVTIGDLSSPSVGSMALSPTQEAQFLRGLWYINYHTAMCGSGEIRGQVSGGGVGGVTQLTDAGRTPLSTTSSSDGHGGLIAGLAAAIAALSLVGASGALLFARRLAR
jgi:hypothetical protein